VAHYIAEHDGNLLALTFDLVPLSQDLLGEPSRQVTLNLLQFLVKREVSGRLFGGNCQIVATIHTVLTIRQVHFPTFWADDLEFGATLDAELGFVTVFKLAFWAFHFHFSRKA